MTALSVASLTLGNVFSVGILIVSVVAAIFVALRKLSRKNIPPGPRASLPFVGHLPDLFPDPAVEIAKWSKEHGDTVSVQYGPKLLVVMHDFETAKAVFNDDNTTGRDADYPQNTFAQGRGIMQSEDELWREHRRFMTRTLRDYGMGKSWLESAILNEVEENMKLFAGCDKNPVDPRGFIEHFTANIISTIAFGKRYEIDDKEYNRFTKAFAENTRLLGPALTPVYLFPWIRFVIPKYYKNWQKFYTNWKTYMPFAEARIQERKSHFVQAGAEAENYVDSYFVEARKQQAQGVEKSTFTDDQLLYSMINMYTAGTASVTTSLLWCFLYMLEYPDEQKKVQAELDLAAGGPNQLVRYDHRPQLKYTDAVLHEIQRCASIVPLGLFHQNFEEMTIDGFTVPKRTLLSASVYSIHHDPRYWKKPDEFYPPHFLDDDGNVINCPKGFLPFGIGLKPMKKLRSYELLVPFEADTNSGKRLCNGEPLAKMELFLYFTNLLHRYEFRVVEGHPVSSNNFTTGLARATAPFKAAFVPRFQA